MAVRAARSTSRRPTAPPTTCRSSCTTGRRTQQKTAKKALDITQWHNYAVEWTPDGIRGYVDGVQWFSSTDSSTLPPGPMHATIQFDYFPDGGSPQPSEMQVAWMRQYQ